MVESRDKSLNFKITMQRFKDTPRRLIFENNFC
jgi:hypothetical protein